MKKKINTFQKQFSGTCISNVPLKDYVAFKIGGPADLFIKPKTEAEIEECVELCEKLGLPLTVIGGGSNLLISDHGIRGVVLYLGAGLIGDLRVTHETKDTVTFTVPAHWPKAHLLDEAIKNKWAGLEFSAGIPGSMGGAVYMNAGTKWGSYGEIIQKVRLFSTADGFFEKSGEDMGFRYRGVGEHGFPKEWIVVSVEIKLARVADVGPTCVQNKIGMF